MTFPLLFFFLLFLSFLLVWQDRRGRRQNLEVLRWLDQEIRRVYAPEDVTYVWIGGVIGATLELKGSRCPDRVVVVLLPRHSLLWYPVSRWLTMRGDRVRVVAGHRARLFVGNLRNARTRERFRRWLETTRQGEERRSS